MTHKATAAPVDHQSPATLPQIMDDGFAQIRDLAAGVRDLHRQMVEAYTPVVQHLLLTRTRDEKQIEQTLDRLLDCACIPEGLALFKSLCRYYYPLNPVATATYIYAYRDLWDSDQPMDSDEMRREYGAAKQDETGQSATDATHL
jgi:hypothetical protein